ncbi:7780_t:CDS:2 [Entrophospora sp. SA101]|nr:7780_t:CDS:2 [Entrophospora sp. SA101]
MEPSSIIDSSITDSPTTTSFDSLESNQKHQSTPDISVPFLNFDLNSKRSTMPVHVATRRAYKKPSKPREFAKSAKKRQSVLALGSITHLQHFYAKRGIIIKPKKPKHIEEAEKKLTINTNTSYLLQVTEEPDDFPPTPLPPSPPPLPTFITSKLDVEMDPDVLLGNCHADIQAMLDAWCMITGEAKSEQDPVPVDILAAVESTTKAVQSIRNYTMVKDDITDESLAKIRSSALEVLEMISDLEKTHRDDDTDDSGSEDGHLYKSSNYTSLDKQRATLQKYIQIVEEFLLFDDKEIYPPNTSYLRTNSDDEKKDSHLLSQLTPPLSPGHPNLDWSNPDHFGSDKLARYHAFLEAHRPSKSKRLPDYTPLPDPKSDKAGFFASLAPFGFIDKIHEDTLRTYRATENLKFFAAAAKFRFDIKFDEFNVAEIVKLTDNGKTQLEKALEIFCEKAMQELISTGLHRQIPLSRASSMYMQDVFSNSQIQLLQRVTTNSNAGNILSDPTNLAAAVNIS